MAKKKQSDVESGYKVVAPFRDKDNFDLEHKIGDDVSHFDEARIADLVERKLVSGSSPKADDTDASGEGDNAGDAE